jgi:hypothetical protein
VAHRPISLACTRPPRRPTAMFTPNITSDTRFLKFFLVCSRTGRNSAGPVSSTVFPAAPEGLWIRKAARPVSLYHRRPQGLSRPRGLYHCITSGCSLFFLFFFECGAPARRMRTRESLEVCKNWDLSHKLCKRRHKKSQQLVWHLESKFNFEFFAAASFRLCRTKTVIFATETSLRTPNRLCCSGACIWLFFLVSSFSFRNQEAGPLTDRT